MKLSPVLFASLAIHSAPGLAQQSPPSKSATPESTASTQAPQPCSTAEYRELDFWVGEWIAEWKNPDGTSGTGRNSITKDEYGQCVIFERFRADDGSLKGMSVSTYFKPAGEWRQTWMDDQGGYFDLYGGPSTEPRQRFQLETYRRRPMAPHLRMVWEDVERDRFTWRWQGRKSAEEPWTDRWVITYRRAAPSK